jgi:hypothetical protein
MSTASVARRTLSHRGETACLLVEEAYEAHGAEAVEQCLRQAALLLTSMLPRRHGQRATTRTSPTTRSMPAATEKRHPPGNEQQEPRQGHHGAGADDHGKSTPSTSLARQVSVSIMFQQFPHVAAYQEQVRDMQQLPEQRDSQVMAEAPVDPRPEPSVG